MTELSIIVPILNEAETLSALFAMLSRQERVAFELILADGGSTDGTAVLAEELAAASTFACRLLHCEKGRGRQLNAGARAAAAGTLLFLHADSAFPDALALRRGLDTLAAAIARRGDFRVAGRFALRFYVPPDRYGFGYYYYECKARLGRTEGIHGDQGFLLVAGAHGEAFGDIRPASTMVQVTGFLEPEWLVEMEFDAVISSGAPNDE
jgi:glycosyltransferase involved in cell wall biosynthesis